MKARIYIRVSTVEQAKEGFSLAAQEERCLQYIRSQGWTHDETYKDDGYSAKDLNRPAMQRLIQDVKEKQFDVLVVYRLDRLVRSIIDLHHLLDLFDKHEIKFKSATEAYDTTSAMGRLFISIVAAMAQWERENLSERVRMGMEQRFLEKKRHGTVAYGYDLVDGKLVVNPEEAKIVRRIHQLYKTNGITRIAHILNQEGLRTKNGSRWSDPAIRYILTNPLYIGQVRYHPKKGDPKYHIVEGDHDPILTKEEFESTQKLLELRRGAVVPPKAMTSDYPFSGVLYCARCGHPFSGRNHYDKKGSGIVRYAYRCTGRFGYGVCDAPEISEIKLQKEFFKYLKYTVAKDIKKPEEPKEEQGPDPSKRIREIEAELERIKKRRKKWQEAFAADAISLEELIERTREDGDREERLKDELTKISLETPSRPTLTHAEFTKAIEDIELVWERVTRRERKELIHSLFRRIEVTKDGNEPDSPIVFTGYELV